MYKLTGLALRATEFDSNSPVEVALLNLGGETQVLRGRFVAFSGGSLCVQIGGDFRRYQPERVRYLSPVDEERHCASFKHGDRVRITKYGGQYTGTVERHMRVNLRVVFTTRGGKVKEASIPAIDCERVS